MNVDIRSSISSHFYEFCRGYFLFQISSKMEENVEYTLVLQCENNDTTVSIIVESSNGMVHSNSYSMDYAMQDSHLIAIVTSFSNIDVDIDRFTVHFAKDRLLSISINTDEKEEEKKGTYFMNQETGKLELYFDKEAYQSLSDSDKSSIKSNYLFSRAKSAWVSRAKAPNLWRAIDVAKKLGLVDKGKSGEKISFEEQMSRKAERAEARAERYSELADKATERARDLQKPINDRHGDIAFFTQPNINSSAGRAFTNRRNKMFDAYERGFEEFKKSDYYKNRAEIALATADYTKPTDKAFCIRRIEEAEKIIRAQKKNFDHYNDLLERVKSGLIVKRHNGETITETMVYSWLDSTEDAIEQNISKSIYYHKCLDELGGVEFSKESIKKGYIVRHQRCGRCRVIGIGPKNFKYEILDGGAAGMGGVASYAEIQGIIDSTEISDQGVRHPFKVGDEYKVKVWDGDKYVDKVYKITKISPDRVTLKTGTERAISRSPRRFRSGESKTGYMWAIGMFDGAYGTIYKAEEVKE